MQFMWKYIDYIVGKGIDTFVIVKLFFYSTLSLIHLALPLSILLSSLMTMGNLGEHYELVAFKSAGISLKRVLKPLSVMIIILAGFAYLFSNYWLPIANLKSKSLLYDVRQQKPTMDLKPGIFSDQMDNFSIRIEDKKEIDGVEHLYDVLIYDHSDESGNKIVTSAKEGIMTFTPDKRYLEMKLFDGIRYREEKDGQIKREYELEHSTFKESLFRIDLSELAFTRTNEELFKTNYQMLNLEQLTLAIDTLVQQKKVHYKAHQEGLKRTSFHFAKMNESTFKQKRVTNSIDFDEFYTALPDSKKTHLLNTAASLSRNAKSRLSTMVNDRYTREKYINRHKIEWHRKLTLPFACIILFLIGAPLGAIIRKGGLGMPIIISVVFFLIFHILSITGEKMAKEGAVPALEGMWMASAILLPLGLFFTYKATSDSAIFSLDGYFDFFKKLFKKKDLDKT